MLRQRAGQQLRRDVDRTQLAYSRGGSLGFLHGDNHQTLVVATTPKHRGIEIGTVREVRARSVLVTEINFGQALVDVRLAVNGRCPVQFIGQPAFPVPATALVEAIGAVARGEKVRPRTFE